MARAAKKIDRLEHGMRLKEEPLRLRGWLEYQLKDARTGQIVQKGKSSNVVTFKGRSQALMAIGSATQPLIRWMMLGTHTSATNSSQTGLGAFFSIIDSTRATTAMTTATDGPCTFTLAASWNTNETHLSSSAINEFALLNSSTTAAGMTMFNRVTTGSVINFGNTNTLSCTITITN